MRDLEIIKPFTMGAYRFTDLRTEPERIKSRIGFLRQIVIQQYPHDLFCDDTTGRVADIRALDRAVDDAAKLRVQRRIDRIKNVRSTRAEYFGEINPINLVIRRDGSFFGAWQMFSINILRETDQVTRIRAGWFPAFRENATPRRIVRLALDIQLEFLDTLIPLQGGRRLDVARWEVPVVTEAGRGTELNVIAEALSEVALRPEFTVERVPIAGQDGRELLRASRSAAPRQQRDDPFEPVGGPSGPE